MLIGSDLCGIRSVIFDSWLVGRCLLCVRPNVTHIKYSLNDFVHSSDRKFVFEGVHSKEVDR